jgi:hypothetical protein
MHPRDGVVVVVNVRNGLHQKVAGKVGWPENWWPTLVKTGGERPAHFSCKYRDYCRSVDVCKGILSVELHHGLPHSLCLPQTSRRRASARCERVASF